MEDSFFSCDLSIIALSPWARFPGTIEMSLNRKKNPTLDDCNCGFGKACSRIFVQQPLDGRMLSLLIWVPVLSFTAQGYFSVVLAAGGGTRAWVCIQLFSVMSLASTDAELGIWTILRNNNKY